MSGRGGYRPGSGRKPGSKNQFTVDIRNVIMQAFHEAGGVNYLLEVARNDPRTFLALVARCVPRTLELDKLYEANQSIDIADMATPIPELDPPEEQEARKN